VAHVAEVPVYVGSGVTADNLARFVPPAAGVIVGSWLKRDGMIANPVDARRVERVRSVLNARTPGLASH
jgi:predicted TIM-barrel enzyme